jgi:hypothetical protein
MLEVEKECVVRSLDDALVLDVEDPVAELVVVVFPPIVVEELTLPPPAVTVVELLPSDELLLSMIVQVAPSFSFIVSASNFTAKEQGQWRYQDVRVHVISPRRRRPQTQPAVIESSARTVVLLGFARRALLVGGLILSSTRRTSCGAN